MIPRRRVGRLMLDRWYRPWVVTLVNVTRSPRWRFQTWAEAMEFANDPDNFDMYSDHRRAW